MRLDPSDWIDRFIYFWNQWEPNETRLIRKVLRPGDTFVDVGANIGYFTLLGSRIVGDTGSVIAIEPTPPTAEKLRSNIALNNLCNVTVHECAAASENGSVRINKHYEINSGMNSLRHGKLSEFWNVSCRRLDDLLSDRSIQFIKMDIEGAELLALLGFKNGLSRQNSPDMLLEISPDMVAALGGDYHEIFDIMREAGYLALRVNDRKLDPIDRDDPIDGQISVFFTKPR